MTRVMKWGLVVLLSLSSCGYHLHRPSFEGGEGKKLNPQSSTLLFVPVVDNLTTRTGFEADLTTAFREAFAGLRGIQLVSGMDSNPRYLLLISARKFDRAYGGVPVTGTRETQAVGGLSRNEISAAVIRVDFGIEVKLVEVLPGDLRRVIWNQVFEESGTYDASRRFTEKQGASSNPHINASRETVFLKGVFETLARRAADQTSQDF
jgi:hypothetical protein